MASTVSLTVGVVPGDNLYVPFNA